VEGRRTAGQFRVFLASYRQELVPDIHAQPRDVPVHLQHIALLQHHLAISTQECPKLQVPGSENGDYGVPRFRKVLLMSKYDRTEGCRRFQITMPSWMWARTADTPQWPQSVWVNGGKKCHTSGMCKALSSNAVPRFHMH